MRRLHATEPLFICCHWWGAFPRGDPHSRSSSEDVELLLEERVPEQCPPFPRRILQHHLVDRGRQVKAGSGSQLFLPWNHSWRRWPFRLFPAWTAAGWTGGVWLGEGIPRWGLQSRISVFCPGAAPAGTSFHKEASWSREHPGLLRSSVWISESQAPVPSKLSHQFQSRLHCKH